MKLDKLLVRIVVGFVLVVALAAFALRSDQVRSTGSIEIAASPYEVWSNLTEASKRHLWMQSVTDAIEVMGAYGTDASSLMLSVSQDGMPARHIYEDVTLSLPPLRLDTQIDDPQSILSVATSYELKERMPGRTTLTVTVDRQLEGWIAPFFAIVIQQSGDANVEHNLAHLKRVVEANL